MLTSKEEDEWFFNCDKPGKTEKRFTKRIESIISISILGKDDFYESLEEESFYS